MRNFISIFLYLVVLLSSAAFAQDMAAVAEANGISADSLAKLQSQMDSAQAAQAFENFLSTPSATGADTAGVSAGDSSVASAQSSSSSDSAEVSSSSGEGGLVLYDAQSSTSERRQYSTDAPIYRVMGTIGLRSPSRGMVSLEYIVAQEIFNIGLHFTDYGDEYFQFGASAIYYPMETRYFYTFLTSDWFHGSYKKERSVGVDYEDYTETVNYWRVVVGIGGEALFMEHFGAYIEAGFEFFAGNGGYYLHCGKKSGTLNNDKVKLPYGVGLLFPF